MVHVSVKALAWIDNWHLFLKILALNQAFKNIYFIKLKCLFYSKVMTLFMSHSSFSGLHGHGPSLLIIASHLKNVCCWPYRGQGCERLGTDVRSPVNTSGKKPKHSDGG